MGGSILPGGPVEEGINLRCLPREGASPFYRRADPQQDEQAQGTVRPPAEAGQPAFIKME